MVRISIQGMEKLLAHPFLFPGDGSCCHSTAESNGKSSNGSKTISEERGGGRLEGASEDDEDDGLGLCTLSSIHNVHS